MRTLAELKERLNLYGEVEYIYDSEVGYLSWRYGTGGNLEPLFIEVVAKRKGNGRELYHRMAVQVLQQNKEPYHSLFCFRLESNKDADQFYHKLGFTQINLAQSVYGGDKTVLMWITWKDFLRNLDIEPT